MTMIGGVSDLHLQRQEDFADDFLRGRIDEQQFRARMARLGYDAWWIDDMVDDMRSTLRDARRSKMRLCLIALLIAAVVALAIYGGFR